MSQSNDKVNTSAAGSIEKEKLTPKELMVMRERVAVRFLIMRTKKFDYSKNPPPPTIPNAKPEKTLEECLQCLGLKRNYSCTTEATQEAAVDDSHVFRKPTVYECPTCLKFFFHKKLLRKHMIYHMKRAHRCIWCQQGFTKKISRRKHELDCRRKHRKLKVL